MTKHIRPLTQAIKAELQHLKWPVFVYSFLGLVQGRFAEFAKQFYEEFSPAFCRNHEEEVRDMALCLNEDHIDQNATMKPFKENRYRSDSG